jgi:hypothetical protein
VAHKNGNVPTGHLVFAWSPNGWTLHERPGEAPPVGTELEEDGLLLVVTKVGPSPLPGDLRACAYTSSRT